MLITSPELLQKGNNLINLNILQHDPHSKLHCELLKPTMEEVTMQDSSNDETTSSTSEGPSEPTRSKTNINAMAESYRNLLVNIGENPDREGLVDTPMRAAKAMMFFTKVCGL